MKQVSNGGGELSVAHLVCGEMLCSFENAAQKGPIVGMDKIPQSQRKVQCHSCKKKSGACMKCAGDKCKNFIHAYCADTNSKCKLDSKGKKAYCSAHA